MAKKEIESVAGVNHKLTEAWALKDLYVKYNGCELADEDFVDFEVLFGGNCAPANLLFLDRQGFTSGDEGKSTDPKVGGLVKIGYTDMKGCDIENEYSITKIDTSKDKKDQSLVQVGLIDKTTRNMKGTYVSKGYPNKNYSDATKEHLNKIGEKEITVVPPKKEEKANIVVGSNKSYHEVFHKTAEDRGYEYKTDRKANYLVHKEHTSFDKLTSRGEVFEYDTDAIALNRIIQYQIKGYDSNAFLGAPPTVVSSDDPRSVNSEDNKKGVDQKQDKKTPKEKKKEEAAGVHTRGAKHVVKTGKQKEYYNSLSNANKMSIWVPGRNINRVGTKVQVNMPRPKEYKSNEYDEVFSGEYEVELVRDKIIGWYFVQELFLRRPVKV